MCFDVGVVSLSLMRKSLKELLHWSSKSIYFWGVIRKNHNFSNDQANTFEIFYRIWKELFEIRLVLAKGKHWDQATRKSYNIHTITPYRSISDTLTHTHLWLRNTITWAHFTVAAKRVVCTHIANTTRLLASNEYNRKRAKKNYYKVIWK